MRLTLSLWERFKKSILVEGLVLGGGGQKFCAKNLESVRNFAKKNLGGQNLGKIIGGRYLQKFLRRSWIKLGYARTLWGSTTQLWSKKQNLGFVIP